MVYTGYELSGYSSDADTDKIKFERFEKSRNQTNEPTFKEQRNTHYKTVKTEPIHDDNANKVFDEMLIDPESNTCVTLLEKCDEASSVQGVDTTHLATILAGGRTT